MITDIEIISNLIDIKGHSPKELSVIQPLGCVCDPRTAARQAPLSSTISQNLLKFMSIESVMLSNHLILCHPLLLLSSIFPSIRVFSNESAVRIRWPKYWSFSLSISPNGLMNILMNIQGWSPLGLIGLISLQALSRVFSSTTIWKHQFFFFFF